MRLRLLMFVGCAVAASLAMAGGVTTSDASSLSNYVLPQLGPQVTVVIVFGLLFKAFSRWPGAERWLVGVSLLMLPPVVTYAFGWLIYVGGTAAYVETLSFWTGLAVLLAVAWWVLKTKTTLLGASNAAGKASRDAQALDQYRREWTAARDAQWEAFANTVAPRPQSVTSPTSAAQEPKPARPAARTNDAIFISYRRQDSADATGRIYDRLIQHFGREQVFKDVDSIPLGVDFREHLGNVVGRCNTLIAVIGPQWKSATGPNGRRLEDKSDFVRVEIEAALARNIPVIPVLIGGAELPADTELPPSIAAITYRNGISVRPDPDFHRDMDRLIAGLQQHGHG